MWVITNELFLCVARPLERILYKLHTLFGTLINALQHLSAHACVPNLSLMWKIRKQTIAINRPVHSSARIIQLTLAESDKRDSCILSDCSLNTSDTSSFVNVTPSL